MAFIEIPFTVVDDQFKKLQRGVLALWRSFNNLPQNRISFLPANYTAQVTALHDAVQRFTANDYARLLQLKATHGWITLQNEADSVTQAIVAYAKHMGALNQAQIPASGASILDAEYRETPGGWLDKLVTYGAWGLGLYFGGKFLLTWYEKQSTEQRYKRPPSYAARR